VGVTNQSGVAEPTPRPNGGGLFALSTSPILAMGIARATPLYVFKKFFLLLVFIFN
jgi:hypothetical protein